MADLAHDVGCDDPTDERCFSPQDVIDGVPAARGPGDRRASAWIDADGETLRAYVAGIAFGGVPLVFFEGDVLAQGNRFDDNVVVWEGYAKQCPADIQREANRYAAVLARPFVNLARPGVLGSTGDHLQRRRAGESAIVGAGLDNLKRRHGWSVLDVAGFSGGGHIVAALLGHRSDIRHAVIASGNVAVRERLKAMGRIVDVTGYHDFLDPIDLAGDVAAHPPQRIVMLTDPRDMVVAAGSQVAYAEALRAAGVAVEQRFVAATDPKRHNLRNEALLAAAAVHPG